MSKSAIQNQYRYIVANEQYLKPLLKNGKISEEVYNEALENLYNEYEIWKYGKIRNPSIEVCRFTIDVLQSHIFLFE